jgi:hypothetical protein
MVALARKLSSFFAFVRVDLYCIQEEAFFGELTFAPEGGAGSLSSEAFGIKVMDGIRRSADRATSTTHTFPPHPKSSSQYVGDQRLIADRESRFT